DLMGSNGQEYRVVFSRVDTPGGQPVSPTRLLALTAKMTPVYIADVNVPAHRVSRTIDPPRRSFWGDVKMPIFESQPTHVPFRRVVACCVDEVYKRCVFGSNP